MVDRPDPAMPRQTPWLFRWFQRYSGRYAAKHFHAVRLARGSAAIPCSAGESLIFAMNHPSWWDLITAFLLSTRVPGYQHYAPIEAQMLEKYRFFARLGLFGVEPTPRGAAKFIRAVKAIFANSHHALWITAQGKFADPRQRPLDLRPGVGAAASRLESGWVVPVAVEYPFWQERTPEMLIRIGQPIAVTEHSLDARQWTHLIEERLTETMDQLAQDSISRDPARFENLIQGRVGVGGVYDWWRSLTGRLRGRPVVLGHGEPEISSTPREESIPQ
ncbi:lysophospholipid acyltransferase family protein [Zavarzinella formosa]|uniref:lysophospholipid acyltransferase family protein n=1 Tax=Zavarzinella formosa TaxID=360055 RepID=UPI00030F296B|nr:lysophospholipid acyltransferase family protein [Zavarzinella formosa]